MTTAGLADTDRGQSTLWRVWIKTGPGQEDSDWQPISTGFVALADAETWADRLALPDRCIEYEAVRPVQGQKA